MSPPYLPICGISMPFQVNLHVPTLIFKNEFPFCVPVPLMKRQGVANIFHARCVILKMSVYSLVIAREYGSNRDAQSRNEKEIYFMLSNNKFLGKCWYGRYPLIRLQRIYNFLLFHAVILSFLDVLQSFYSNSISFFGTNLFTQCPVPVAVFACFLHRRKSISNGVQTPRNFLWIFYGPEDIQWARAAPGGVLRGGHNPPGCAWGPRRAQVGCAHLGGLPHPLFTLY